MRPSRQHQEHYSYRELTEQAPPQVWRGFAGDVRGEPSLRGPMGVLEGRLPTPAPLAVPVGRRPPLLALPASRALLLRDGHSSAGRPAVVSKCAYWCFYTVLCIMGSICRIYSVV